MPSIPLENAGPGWPDNWGRFSFDACFDGPSQEGWCVSSKTGQTAETTSSRPPFRTAATSGSLGTIMILVVVKCTCERYHVTSRAQADPLPRVRLDGGLSLYCFAGRDM